MLINLSEISESQSILDRPYIGKVVNNADPLKQGRVRCTIAGLIDDATNAPWIIQKNGTSYGGKTDSGSFAVPPVGAELVIEFPYKDIYAAEYSGSWMGKNTVPSEATSGYPDKVVLAQIEGFSATYDKATTVTEIKHPSGTIISIKETGDVEIKSAMNILLNVEGVGQGMVLTTTTDPVIDLISGVPTVGVLTVKAGV